MRYLILLIVLVVSSCMKSDPYIPTEMPIKWCVDKCVDAKFNAFTGGKFLGGSSSMGGMIQKDIFKEVLSYCQAYYVSECFENESSRVHGSASDDGINRWESDNGN